MKKITYLSYLSLFIFLPALLPAQTFNFTTTQQGTCWSVGNKTIAAAVTATAPGASTYSFLALSAGGATCLPVLNYGPGNGSMVTITFPCCGSYTINCFALSSFSIPIATSVKTATLSCGGGPITITNSVPGSTLCAGSSATLSATGTGTFSWSNGGSGSSIVVTPTASTCYTVTRASACGIDTSSKCITVNLCTGLDKTTKDGAQVKIYPNPASGVLNMINNEGGGILNYSIVDITGREITHGSFTSSITLDVSAYSRGAYFIRFENGKNFVYKKLVIE